MPIQPICSPREAAQYLLEIADKSLTGIRGICYYAPRENFDLSHITMRTPHSDGVFEPLLESQRLAFMKVFKELELLGIGIVECPPYVAPNLLQGQMSHVDTIYLILHSYVLSEKSPNFLHHADGISDRIYIPHLNSALTSIGLRRDKPEDTFFSTIVHEIGHAIFSLNHYPFTKRGAPIYPGCMGTEYAREVNPTLNEKIDGLIDLFACEHPYNTPESSLMYCELRDTKNQTTIPEVDRIAFKEHFFKYITSPKLRHRETNNTQSITYNRTDLLTSPSTNNSVVLSEEKSITKQHDYSLLSTKIFKSFIFAFTLTIMKQIAKRPEFKPIKREYLEEGIIFILTVCFYGIPVAFFSMGISHTNQFLFRKLKAYPRLSTYIAYLNPMIPIVLTAVIESYNRKALLSILQSTYEASVETAISMISSIFGVGLANLLTMRIVKEKME